jgi:AraC-like DNA-binding protein
MLSGSTGRFEGWLGHPDWFRNGTSLDPHPAPLPAMLSMADDLAILGNIVSHGCADLILDRILKSARPPYAPGWTATIALAPTLEEAIGFLLTELPSRNPYLQLERAGDSQRADILVRTAVSGPPRALIAIAPLLLFLRQIRLSVDDLSDCLLECDLDRMAGVDAILQDVGLSMRWNAPANRLSIPRDWLGQANEEADPVLWVLARQHLQEPEQRPGHLAQSVAAHIGATLSSRMAVPRLPDVAAAVGLSERTLVRRLGQAGTSFTALVEQERRTLALLLLRDPGHRMQDVAEALGFPDAGRFGRAFRKWFPESPAHYRRRLLRSANPMA